MENIIAALRLLQKNLPANCTRSGLIRLQTALQEYQKLVGRIPDQEQGLKATGEINHLILQQKIHAVTDAANSLRDAKFYYKDAIAFMHHAINALIMEADMRQS